MRSLGEVFYRGLGRKLRKVRTQAGLRQEAVGLMMGLKPGSSQASLSRLEKGNVRCVRLDTIVGYLRACRAPIGKFMLELAQSGVFGEAEQGLTVVVEDKLKNAQAKRAKAKLLYQKRWERESQDSAIIARLWSEVMPAIQSLLPSDPSRRLMTPYLEGVRAMCRAWKQAVRGAVNHDPVPDVQMAFDRIEQAGVQRLAPAAVRKMREIVFDRLMRMVIR